jgi:hypothetical protein
VNPYAVDRLDRRQKIRPRERRDRDVVSATGELLREAADGDLDTPRNGG